MGRTKNVLSITSFALILMGVLYALTGHQVFGESAYIDAYLMEFVPEECEVIEASRGVSASIEFERDTSGNIVDKTQLHMAAAGVYEGSKSVYGITMINLSDIPLAVEEFKLEVDRNNSSLEDLIYFSGSVKISVGGKDYLELLGTFKSVGLYELAKTLSAITEYWKIDSGEKLVFEICQHFENNKNRFSGKTGLSYELVPVVVQYF